MLKWKKHIFLFIETSTFAARIEKAVYSFAFSSY